MDTPSTSAVSPASPPPETPAGLTPAQVQEMLDRCLEGAEFSHEESGFGRATAPILEEAMRLTAELNAGYRPPEQVREILGRLTGRPIPESVQVITPFSTDFGRHIFFGERVFVNKECMLVDLGGIVLEDDALLAPRVTILTVNHIPDPTRRRGVITAGVRICRNAWIGASATICPGVTVGENAVVGAGSVVTRDVPANTVVAGVPAKVVKEI